MKTHAFPHAEKVAFGAGLVGLGLAVAGSALQRPTLAVLRPGSAAVELTGEAYVPVPWGPTPSATPTWEAPRAQSAGAGWIYEVFTPPPISFDAAARTFALSLPDGRAVHPAAFGLELLDVKPEPYRLQLVGYLGRPGDYLGAFFSPLTRETLLARSGRSFAGLGLALRSLEVRKVETGDDPTRPVGEIAALAVVQEEETGELVTLDSRTRKFTALPVAVLRLAAGPSAREVREGEMIEHAGNAYRIERIQLDPPEVAVSRLHPGADRPETRVLTPVAAVPAAERWPAGRLAPPPPAPVAATSTPP